MTGGGTNKTDRTVVPALRSTPAFTCKARLNDWPSTNETGHSSAPCLVQGLVVQPADLGDRWPGDASEFACH